MKILKNILKIALVYGIGMVLVYSLVLRVKEIDKRDQRILQEKENTEYYYVYENK